MVAAPPLDRVTVATAIARYLDNVDRAVRGHSLSATTASNYVRDLGEFRSLVGPDTILDDLTASNIDDAVLDYGDTPDNRYTRPRPGLPTKTRGQGAQARFRQSVSRLFSEAVLEGWVQASPMPRTKVRPTTQGMTNAARKALPQSSAIALIGAANPGDHARRPDQQLGLRDEFVLRLLVETGPRVSEVSGANQADIERRDDESTWLRLLGKGNKERWVPLSAGTITVYEQYLAIERPPAKPRTRLAEDDAGNLVRVTTGPIADAEDALVLTWRGLRMMPRDIQLLVERAYKRLPADVRRAVTPHGLRHTAATLLLTSGAADVKTVQALLGHASIATTGLYLDTVDTALVQAINDHPVTGRKRF